MPRKYCHLHFPTLTVKFKAPGRMRQVPGVPKLRYRPIQKNYIMVADLHGGKQKFPELCRGTQMKKVEYPWFS